jgi:hypothetical protein
MYRFDAGSDAFIEVGGAESDKTERRSTEFGRRLEGGESDG